MLCKVNYLLGKENEFLRVNGLLSGLIKFFYEGQAHPILIKVFEFLGDLFQKAGYFPTSLSYLNEAYLMSKLHLGFTHPLPSCLQCCAHLWLCRPMRFTEHQPQLPQNGQNARPQCRGRET